MLAYLASKRDDLHWAARLHGANEVLREANGLTLLPFLQPLHDESLERILAGIGEAARAEEWRRGRTAPIEKTVAEALSRAPD